MGLCSTIMEEVTWYTGLTPTAFFSILAMMILVYRTVCGMFVSPEEFNRPPIINATSISIFNKVSPPTNTTRPVQVGEITEQELLAYNGSDPNKPLLVSVTGEVYDVSSSRMFYGPGGPYSMFAGKECSRALALLSFKPGDMNWNLEGLEQTELEILQEWLDKFRVKYVKVGRLVSDQNSEDSEKLSLDRECWTRKVRISNVINEEAKQKQTKHQVKVSG